MRWVVGLAGIDDSGPKRTAALLVGLLALAACDTQLPSGNVARLPGKTMGTTYTVKVVGGPSSLDVRTLNSEISTILTGVERRMSTYREDSELSQFNQSKTTEWLDVSPELLAVIQEALEVSRISEGAFDVSIGPVVNLWGFGPLSGREKVPSSADIRAVLATVGYTRIPTRQSPPGIRKENPDLYVDLSAIAKGYGVDKVAEYLESVGVRDYLVEVGGELKGKGTNDKGEPWRIAIEKPVRGARAIQGIVRVDGQAVATSGDYRNYFERDGERYSHMIDPLTGRPITHGLASVTVIAPSAMRADAMATALMVLGPDAGYALAERADLAALLIIKDGAGFTERATARFSQYVVQ